MSVWANFADVFIYGECVTELAREIQLNDWSTAGNLSDRSSGVQIPRDICTRFGRYLYSTKCSWIITIVTFSLQKRHHPELAIGCLVLTNVRTNQ